MIKDHPPYSGPPPSSSAPLSLHLSIPPGCVLFCVPSPAPRSSHIHTRLSLSSLRLFPLLRPRPSPIFPLRSVSPSAFSNPPTRSLPNHFLLLSTYSFSAICHSRLSLGKLQLFYVLDLPPYPSLPPLLLCLFPSGSPLRCRLSCLFSSRLHYCLFHALSMSAYVCLYAVLELKRWSSVPSFVFLLHPPPPHSPLAFCSLRERSLSCLRLSLAHTFSFPSL